MSRAGRSWAVAASVAVLAGGAAIGGHALDTHRGLLGEASPAIPQHTQDRPVEVIQIPTGDLLPITRANARTLPRCAAEDGPGPCYWDASSAGNGIGHSFWIGADACTHYFLPSDEARWGDKSSPCEDPYGN